MSINILITERLRGFVQVIRNINNYKCDSCSNNDDNIITSDSVKAVLDDVMCSKKLKERLMQRSCGKKETSVKRNENVSCFGQRCLWNGNHFYYMGNEVDLINVNLCYLMFDVIKACLMYGIDVKGRFSCSYGNFMLTPKVYNRKRCMYEVYRSRSSSNIIVGGSCGINKDKYNTTGMNMLSKLRICNRSVESSHKDNNTKYISVKVGTTPRLKELSCTVKHNNNIKQLFNISKTRRESLQRQAPYGQRKGYLKVGYYIKQPRTGDISNNLRKCTSNININGYNNNYNELFKYYNMLNYS